MEHILVGIDERRPQLEALAHGCSLAKRIQARLYVLFVQKNRPDTATQTVRQRLELLVSAARADGIQVEYLIAEGGYEEAIISFVRNHVEGGRLALPFSDIGIEAEDEVGGKISQLGDLSNRLHLRTPDGFAITTAAFFTFMSRNGLLEMAENGIAEWDGSEQALHELADQMQESIMDSPLPWGMILGTIFLISIIFILDKTPFSYRRHPDTEKQ